MSLKRCGVPHLFSDIFLRKDGCAILVSEMFKRGVETGKFSFDSHQEMKINEKFFE